MKMVKVTKMLGIAKEFASKNSPSILTGIGVFGFCATVYLAVKATKRSCDILQDCTDEEGNPEELTKTEVVTKCWKEYIPVAGMGVASIGCIVGAHVISLKRQAALMGLYSMTETALKKYEAAVKEEFGEEKKTELDKKLAEREASNHHIPSNILMTDDGDDVLCFDPYSGRYFKSNANKINRAINEFTAQVLGDFCASVNDFYYHLGLDGIEAGDEVGWSTEEPLQVEFDSSLTSDAKPLLVMRFKSKPTYRYQYGRWERT